MPYHTSYGSDPSDGSPCFTDTLSSRYFSQDQGALVQNAWMENIHPLLRSVEADMSFHNQQRPLDRYIDQSSNRFLFNAEQLPPRVSSGPHPLSFIRQTTPIQPLPQATHIHQAMPLSPSPSSQDPGATSTGSSSARSPGPETEWDPSNSSGPYSPSSQPHHDNLVSLPQDTSCIGRAFDYYSLPYHPSAERPCVAMSQVQGVPDLTWEVENGGDESIIVLGEPNGNLGPVRYHNGQPQQRQYQQHTTIYNYQANEEEMDGSIQDESSPPEAIPSSTPSAEDGDDDVDAEGEADDQMEVDTKMAIPEDPIPEDPIPSDEDGEYKPNQRSTTSRARKATRRNPSPKQQHGHAPHNPSRVSKHASPKSKARGNKRAGHHCAFSPFPDNTARRQHMASTHQTRPFVCVFHFAGCHATFASKNEWKRHVSSQHLNLDVWICSVGNCKPHLHANTSHTKRKSQNSPSFNRKDLFTQHLRRMHEPFAVTRQLKHHKDGKAIKGGPSREWEEDIKVLQITCRMRKRQSPNILGCPRPGCKVMFEGAGAWDDRMEHVGRHLEQVGNGNGEGGFDQGKDELLITWALDEGIIERRLGVSGGYRLCPTKGRRNNTDTDVEGEDD